jgi:hypothetical protein
MKIELHRGYILIISPWLTYAGGAIHMNGIAKRVKGFAAFPFIVMKEHSALQPWTLNHELIHFRQQLETLFVGALVIYIFERLYARLVLKLSPFETYLYSAFEQEAFLNQNNPNYLRERKWFSLFHYIRHKKKIDPRPTGEVLMG